MSYEEKIMVAAGAASHEDEVKLETKHRAPGGHVYDLEPSSDKSELLFKEDSTLKSTIPVNTNFAGTRAAWNALTAVEKAKYLTMDFDDEGGFGDISYEDVTFTSSDVVDGNANAWTVVSPITTGLSLNTLFSRVSQMFKNVRYLYKSAPPIGTINAFGGTTAPDGWLLCQGQDISRTKYSKLFSVIGTNFGAGNGSTTFNVPDLRGEFLRGAGTNSRSDCGSGGSVGQHQAPTKIPTTQFWSNGTGYVVIVANGDANKNALSVSNQDTTPTATSYYCDLANGTFASRSGNKGTYTVRPTNTSVNFIIRAE